MIEETRLLVELGHPVHLAAFVPPHEGTAAAEILQAELHRETGADVHVLPTSHFFDLSPSDASAREIRDPLARLACEHGVHVIHGQACYAATWALQAAGQVPGLKVVFDCHGISPEETRMTDGHERRVLGVERLERTLLEKADMVVLVSQQMGVHFQRKYALSSRRSLLLPCCVDLAKFADEAALQPEAREAFGLSHDHHVVAYAGTMAEWQWPVAMFRLFAAVHRRLGSARLLLLVPERDQPKALAALETAGVPAGSYVMREIAGTDIGRVLGAADAGLLLRQDHPVNFVSSPTKFGEYMAAGVPAIATAAVGDFAEWIREHQTGMVVSAGDEGVSPQTADAICAFLAGIRADREHWRARCRSLASDRLNWRGRIRELSQAYGSLVTMPGTGRNGNGNGSTVTGFESPAPATKNRAPAPLKILFNGHDLKFARPIIEHFSRDPLYEVRVDEWSGHNICTPGQPEEMIGWADVIFCEWCLGNARWYSQRKRPGQRLIVRLHHQEMQLPYRFQLDWANTDAIIFINHQHYDSFASEQPEHADKAIVIYNVIECSRFDQDKLPGADFNLGFIGMNPIRKRPDLAFEILSRLREVDSRYTLSFKTAMPWEYKWLWERASEREAFTQFFQAIEDSPHANAVLFDPHGSDMPEWFSKIGFILSTSDHEGSHQAVAEGMAAGCVPVIRDWEGATPLYPPQYVFSEVDQAVGLIRRCSSNGEVEGVAAECRTYARERFDTSVIMPQLEALMREASPRQVKGLQATEALSRP